MTNAEHLVKALSRDMTDMPQERCNPHLINGAKAALKNAEGWLAMIPDYPGDDKWFAKCMAGAAKCKERAEAYLKSAGIQ